MIILLLFQFGVSAMMFLLVHLTKHWKLLVLPSVFREFDLNLQAQEIGIYIMISYLSFFYGNLVGSIFWKYLSQYISKHTSIILSLIFLALFTYLQSINNAFKSFLIFRFLTGFTLNLENINKSFIHEIVDKKYRAKAFFIESGSHTFGTMAGPFFGLLLYHLYDKFESACFVIMTLLFVTVVLYIIAFLIFSFKDEERTASLVKKSSADFEDQEENIPFKKWGTVIIPTWQEAMIHSFWVNKISRYLLIVFLTNAASFHINLVLTTTFLAFSHEKGEYVIDTQVLAVGNLLGSFGSLASIYYLSTLNRDPHLYKLYMFVTIVVNVVSMIICPFLKIFISPFSQLTQEFVIYFFYIFKEFVSFYLYNQILIKIIMMSIHKIYRRQLNFVVVLVKALANGMLFTALMPFFYLTINKTAMKAFYPFNYAICFWLVALVQLSTLPFFKYMKLPLQKREI